MTVYVCLGSDYDDSWVTGVFSTLQLAEAHIAAHAKEHSESRACRIESYELDRVFSRPLAVTGRT